MRTRRADAERPPERRLWRNNPEAARVLYAAITASLLAVACWLAFAVLLAQVIGRVFIENESMSGITRPLIAMLALGLLRALLTAVSGVLALDAALQVKQRLRAAMTTSITERGPLFVRGERAGELVHIAVQGIESLDAYVRDYLPARWLAALAPLLVTVVVFAIDPLTVPILLFAGPILVLIMALIGQRTGELAQRRERELGWLSAHFLDVLQGLTTLRLFGRSQEQAATIDAISRGHSDLTMSVLRTAFQTSLVLEWGAMAATALVAVTVSVRLMTGSMPFEQALALIILTPEFFLPLRELAKHYHAGSAGTEVLNRVYEITSPTTTPASSEVGEKRQAMTALQRPFSMELRDLRFRYDGAEHEALANVSICLEPGRLTGLRGPTGAGKSTIASLLLRFAEPLEGAMLADGVPIAQVPAEEWRRYVAFVPQHPHLIAGTIADNLRQGRPDATFEELASAAKLAAAHDFISRLPHGYETQVGERGARLSGGQLQRIAIARAVLRDAPVLIMDEATTHLDEATETAVLEAINSIRHDRIVLIISHNEAVLRHADAIVTLGGGVIGEPSARSLAA